MSTIIYTNETRKPKPISAAAADTNKGATVYEHDGPTGKVKGTKK